MDVELESSAPAIPPKNKPRYKQKARPGNSRGKNDDAFRLHMGKKVEANYRAQRTAKFTSKLPSDLFTLGLKTPIAFAQKRPLTPLVKRIPFSTIGNGLAVSEIHFRFVELFRGADCPIYSLYRATLAQLGLQQQTSHEGGISVYSYDSLYKPFDTTIHDLVKAHPDNFKILVYIIETFGKISTVVFIPHTRLPRTD